MKLWNLGIFLSKLIYEEHWPITCFTWGAFRPTEHLCCTPFFLHIVNKYHLVFWIAVADMFVWLSGVGGVVLVLSWLVPSWAVHHVVQPLPLHCKVIIRCWIISITDLFFFHYVMYDLFPHIAISFTTFVYVWSVNISDLGRYYPFFTSTCMRYLYVFVKFERYKVIS